MSDESKPTGSAPAETTSGQPIENLKAEFNRKFSELAETNKALLKQIQAMQQPKPTQQPAPQKKLGDLLYDDPEQAVNIIKEQAKQEFRTEWQTVTEAQNRRAEVVNQLYSEFPELVDQEHDFTKKTLERYGSLSDNEKQDPKSLKLAAMEVAMELGVKPKRLRSEDEAFTVSSGAGGGTRRPKSDRLPPEVLEFAARAGLNVEDPKVVERLKARAKRSNWGRYE